MQVSRSIRRKIPRRLTDSQKHYTRLLTHQRTKVVLVLVPHVRSDHMRSSSSRGSIMFVKYFWI